MGPIIVVIAVSIITGCIGPFFDSFVSKNIEAFKQSLEGGSKTSKIIVRGSAFLVALLIIKFSGFLPVDLIVIIACSLTHVGFYMFSYNVIQKFSGKKGA